MTEQAHTPGPPRAAQRAFEPVANALAGSRWFPLWATIHHRGRRSGTAYATPVAVVPTTDRSTILIGLPWGAHTNWARNVVAAEGATLTWRGREVAASHPRMISCDEAAALARPFLRFIVRRMPAAIVLRREAAPTPPS
jgi:deazaflavin-dependent oxidoreductase (nitroreductase family)